MSSSSSTTNPTSSTNPTHSPKDIPYDFGICYPVTEFRHGLKKHDGPDWYDRTTKTWRPRNGKVEREKKMNGGQYGISTKNSTEDFEEDFDCYRINIDKDHFKHDQLKVHKNGVKFSYNMPLHYRNFLLTEVSKGFENMPSSKKQYGTEYRYFDEKLLHVAHRMTLRSWAICMEKKIADRYVGMPSTLPDEIFGLIMDFSDFYDPFLMLPHFGIPWPPNGMWPIESARREVEERHLTGYAVYDHNMFSEEARERRNKPSLKDMREKRRAKRELKKKGLAPIFMKKRDANNESSAFINMKKPDEYFYRGPEGGDASEIFKNPKCSGKFTYVNTLTGKVQKETPPKHLIKEGRVDRLWKKQREEEKKRRAQFKPTWYCRQMPFTDYEDWTKKTWKNASPKRKKRQEYYLEEYFFLTSDDDSDVGEFDPMEKWSADHQIGQGHETRLPGLDERFLRHPCNDLNVFLCENIIPEGGLKSPTTKSEKSKYYFADRMDGMRCKNGDGYENATYYDVVEMSPYSESITGLPISQIHPNKRYYRYMPEICVEEQLRLIDVYNKCAEEKGMSKLSTEYQYPDADWTDFSGNQKTFFCFICGETHDVYQHSLCNRTDNWRKTDYRGANITPKKEEYKSKTQLEAAVANNKQYCGADEIDMYKRVKLAEKYMENRKAILEMESSDDEN